MDKVQKHDYSKCSTPSSEPFGTDLTEFYFNISGIAWDRTEHFQYQVITVLTTNDNQSPDNGSRAERRPYT
jgi:hypothetical protein